MVLENSGIPYSASPIYILCRQDKELVLEILSEMASQYSSPREKRERQTMHSMDVYSQEVERDSRRGEQIEQNFMEIEELHSFEREGRVLETQGRIIAEQEAISKYVSLKSSRGLSWIDYTEARDIRIQQEVQR